MAQMSTSHRSPSRRASSPSSKVHQGARRGQNSWREYVLATVLLQQNDRGMARMFSENGFDVVGGVDLVRIWGWIWDDFEVD